MLIPVNQNIDEYKDDFYKGLTLRQSVISLITVAVGAVVYLGLTMLLHLPQTLALYVTLPVVFPIAAYGFLKIHGMNIAEYVKKRGAVKERSSYTFIPQMLLMESAGEEETGGAKTKERSEADGVPAGKKQADRRKKGQPVYLETEETIREIEVIRHDDADDGKEEMHGT